MEQQGDYWKAADKKVEQLGDLYDFEWEKRENVVIQNQDNIVRLFSDNRKINQYKIVEGSLPKEREVMLDYHYAGANNLKVGDTFIVEKQKYQISAIVVLPDMISPIVDNTGKMYDKKT